MRKEGLGEDTEFSTFHPLVTLVYFIFIIGITMFAMSPIFLGITLIAAWIYSIILKGIIEAKFNFIVIAPTIIIMTLINALFTHNGETVLFYIDTNRITFEAVVYGFCAAIMLTAVIIWFSCFNVLMTSDKFIYIFGKIAPILGLTLSMIFRFIPLLKGRFAEISNGQKCMGSNYCDGIIGKTRQFLKKISILISWSLEASIETADSMEARGYGLKGRTSFHLFKFTRKDFYMIMFIAFFGGLSLFGCMVGKATMYYYPKLILGKIDFLTIITIISYSVLLISPIIIDLIGEKKWKQLNLET